MAVLKVIKGSCPGQLVELQGERIVMGRHPSCQFVLDNAAVSRNHAQILESHGTYYLEDLRSRNGTMLNGVRIHGRTELADSDEIRVCEVVLRFYLGVPPDSAVARKPKPLDLGGTVTTPAPTISETDAVDFQKLQAAGEDSDRKEPGSADSSSIITSLDVKGRNPRITIRPEAKLRAILEISQNLARALKPEEVLPKILESLFKIFPQADRGFIVLKDMSQGTLHIKSQRVRRDELLDSTRISMTILKEAMSKGCALLSADAAADERFKLSESVAAMTIRSVMCAPLMGPTNDALGAIQIDTVNHAQPFAADDLEVLASVAAQASLALENAQLHSSALKQRDLERDLDFATQVQLGFLPNHRPHAPGYEFFEFYEAAQRVGGDFFDYIPLPDGRVAITIGDVAGKGVPAALLMARIYSDTRYQLLAQPTPATAMTALNAGVSASGLGHRFITLAMVVLDPRQNTLTIVNAGHLPPLQRQKNGAIKQLGTKTSGLPLGIQSDTVYQQTQMSIDAGDIIVMSTDGVTEAMNPAHEIYGTARLMALLKKGPSQAEELGEAIVAEIDAFVAGHSQRDDICLICFHRQE
ncbi:MAG: SpoIIE family protein phosphatase [Planctomycetes bacterium]|nr:SpoIIE family protein phosphatase [Planctomycetota bacterium]